MADELNIQVAAEGFGSYLEGILPKDVAIACGAFSASMQQVRNILSVDFEKFAQVAASIESIKGLAQINGSDVPVITQLAQQGFTRTAIGSGPDGAYTMSDFFGCMSGLPYLWSDIQNGILALQTQILQNIYHELFLSVTWEQATSSLTLEYDYDTVSVGYFTPITDPLDPLYPGYWTPSTYQRKYRISSVSLLDNGGGYGRGTAPAPTVTFVYGAFSSDGASATTTIGINDNDAGSMGGGSFGRVTSLNFSIGSFVNYGSVVPAADGQLGPPTMPGAGAPVANTDIQIQIQAPPTVQPGVIGPTLPTGYSNQPFGTTGWPNPMNGVIYGSATSYVNQANDEIARIRSTQPYKSVNLNTVYNAAGTQLTIEQRARFTGISPVPTVGFGDVVGRDDFLNTYPTALHNFVDAIPSLAQDTKPHMAAQTLEAISNLSLPGGQSIVGMMRQERNSARLQEIGVELDNNIPGKLEINVERLLITNGTLPIGQAGIAITGVNGNATNSVTTYTNPSVLITRDDTGALVSPVPSGYLDPELNLYLITNPNFNNTGATDINETSPIDEILNLGLNNPNNQNVLGPSLNGTGPRSVLNSGSNTTPGQGGIGGDGSTAVSPKNAQPLNTQTGSNTPTTLKQAVENARNQLVGPPIAPVRVGARLPVGNGSPYDNGGSIEPGSLAGSKAKDLLPTNLNATYTSGILTPSIYSVSEAIDEVIKCNCDCWVD